MECFWNECPSFDKSPPAELGSNFSHSFPNSFPFWCIDSYLCPSLICAPSSQKWPFQWKKQHGFASSLHIRAVQSINPFHLGQGFNLRKYPKKNGNSTPGSLSSLIASGANQQINWLAGFFPHGMTKSWYFIFMAHILAQNEVASQKIAPERTWNNIRIQSQGLPLDYFSNLYFFHNPSPAPPPKKKKKNWWCIGVSQPPHDQSTSRDQHLPCVALPKLFVGCAGCSPFKIPPISGWLLTEHKL